MRRFIVVILAVGLAATACNRGDDATTETTLVATSIGSASDGVVTSTAGTTASTLGLVEDTTVATTIAIVIGMPTYEVIGELEGGDLVIVVESGSYTNVELENMVFDIVDRFAPEAAIVVDEREAADLLLAGETTDRQELFLAQHTLVQIESGVEVTFLGPYADFPDLTIGS